MIVVVARQRTDSGNQTYSMQQPENGNVCVAINLTVHRARPLTAHNFVGYTAVPLGDSNVCAGVASSSAPPSKRYTLQMLTLCPACPADKYCGDAVCTPAIRCAAPAVVWMALSSTYSGWNVLTDNCVLSWCRECLCTTNVAGLQCWFWYCVPHKQGHIHNP